jgi:DNA-binding CsgD family transcriptional regulator
MGVYDSAFYYNTLWSAINDSLEKVVATSSLAITKARLNDETSRYNIQKMNREEKAELLTRNFIIAAIILISIIVFLYLNRSRIKLRYQEQTARAETKAAGEQLQLFTQNIIEKTILIEKLEQQVKANEYNIDQHQLIEELAHQTILTEDDWLKFKMLFEKTHPGFFTKLKEQVSDITQAEQRMAALTSLHLTTKQMAAILGISPNSVIKAKQRLRLRFNFETDFHVEEFLAKL